MNKFKKNKGITLVALIITIIVLLILAVVSIRAVTGDGIIQYAKNARSEYEKGQTNEVTMLDSYLKELDDATKTDGNSEVFEKITATDYGKKIEYNDPAGVSDWKVFYKDSDYLYIIASNYLENTKLPSGLTMTAGNSIYGISWYGMDTSIGGASTITSAVANKYGLSWLTSNSSSTNVNAKVTAGLLNTAVWTAKFGDSSKGIEAIGSPTLEMWVASWNEKGYTKLYTSSNATGYYIGTTEKPTSCYQSVSSDTAGYADTLYFPHTSYVSDCRGYWLASPSYETPYSIINVQYDGHIGTYSYAEACFSVRPLVSVSKDLVTMVADGTLKVVE